MTYTISPVTVDNAVEVARIFRCAYAESFPLRYVYHPNEIMAEINGGDLCAALAFTPDAGAVGYISAQCCPAKDC